MIPAFTRTSFIPLTLRKKVGRLSGAPNAGQTFEADVLGLRYYGVTGTQMDDKIYLYGAHEAATLRLIRRILQTAQDGGGDTVMLI